jgi:hypothetical protein
MAKKQSYKMLFSFEALDIVKSEQTNSDVTKYFEEGDIVVAEPYMREKIIVECRYIIPTEYVEKSDEFTYLKKSSDFDQTMSHIKDQSVKINEKKNAQLDSVGLNVKDVIEGNTKKKITADAKAYKNGALLGLGAGVITALYFKKSVWSFGIIGLAVGGYVAHKIKKAKEGNNKVDPINT